MKCRLLITLYLMSVLSMLALPALAGSATLHETVTEPYTWNLVLAGLMLLVAIGRKHFAVRR